MNGAEYDHIVGDIQHWLGRLRLAVPRALCGLSMAVPPGTPPLPDDAPMCPICASRAEWVGGTVPARQVRIISARAMVLALGDIAFAGALLAAIVTGHAAWLLVVLIALFIGIGIGMGRRKGWRSWL